MVRWFQYNEICIYMHVCVYRYNIDINETAITAMQSSLKIPNNCYFEVGDMTSTRFPSDFFNVCIDKGMEGRHRKICTTFYMFIYTSIYINFLS